MSDLEPKRRLRWLRWVAVGFFALAIVFGILTFLPERSSFEPAWLAKLPTFSYDQRVYEHIKFPPTPSGPSNDVQITECTRFVDMPFEAFVLKLNKDLRPEGGWRYTRPNQTFTASWNRSNESGSSTIWIIQEGQRIRVSSSDARIMTWFDKVKRSLFRFFKR